jgi:hypothetical protein
MTPEEIEAVLNRPAGETQDPTLLAVIEFVTDMCDAAVRDATGFTTARVTNQMRDVARAKFIAAMEKVNHEG